MLIYVPNEEAAFEEMRVLSRKAWGSRRISGKRAAALVNVDRMAKMFSIADNPYLELSFGHKSTMDLMRICAWHMMENLDFRHGGRLLLQIAQLELAQGIDPDAKPGREPEPEPDEDAEPAAELPPLPKALTPEEIHLRNLPDREIARRLKILYARRANDQGSALDPLGPAAPDPLT